MINARSKGRRNENKTKLLYIEEGWLIEQTKGSTKWNRSVDLFGLFDHIGIKKLGDTTYHLYSQTKTNEVKKKVKEDLKLWKDKYCDNRCVVELVIWKDRKGFKRMLI